jgi:Fic family protein
LEEKLVELNALRPIPSIVMKKLRDQFQLEMTYNTNAIEGNTLSLKETFWVIREGVTVKGKPLKDHLEAKDQNDALDHLHDMVEFGQQTTFSEVTIRQLHSLVVKTSDSDISGKYRDGSVMIMGSDHAPPEASEIPMLMNSLMSWLNGKGQSCHPVEQAAWAHHQLTKIHPFWDGNGRVARLVMNLILMRAGYPMAVILKVDRKRYYRFLSEADGGDLSSFFNFVAQSVLRSLNIYLKSIRQTPKDQRGVSLIELAKSCEYSAAYLRKLATQGKLEAWKEGRNWLSTQQAIHHYQSSLKSGKRS